VTPGKVARVPTSQIALECAEERRDFLGMLNLRGGESPFSDITLKVDGLEIQCHQVILASRSLYFEALLAHDFKEKEQRVVDFASSGEGLTKDSFILMLKHIYSDSIRVEPKQIYDLLSVSTIISHHLQLADRFGVVAIKKRCEQILAQLICVENVCNIFKFANTFNCERLKETCLLFTEEHYQEVISSAGFEDLDKDEILKIIRMGKQQQKGKAR